MSQVLKAGFAAAASYLFVGLLTKKPELKALAAVLSGGSVLLRPTTPRTMDGGGAPSTAPTSNGGITGGVMVLPLLPGEEEQRALVRRRVLAEEAGRSRSEGAYTAAEFAARERELMSVWFATQSPIRG